MPSKRLEISYHRLSCHFKPMKKQYKRSISWPAPLGVIGNTIYRGH